MVSSAVCTVLGSEEISGVANKEDLSPLNSVTVGESQQMEVLDNVANKTTGSSDHFAWLDYVEAETVIGENASVSQKEDAPEMCGKTRLLYKFKIQKSCYFHTKKKAKKKSVVEEMEISQFSSLQQAGKEESCNDSAADSCTSGNVQRDSPIHHEHIPTNWLKINQSGVDETGDQWLDHYSDRPDMDMDPMEATDISVLLKRSSGNKGPIVRERNFTAITISYDDMSLSRDSFKQYKKLYETWQLFCIIVN
ncbi:hypothetical protein KIW84_061672 [Lathyrus oleraceus]|uniref:Uncharacterized protein n=1 Tax=Pisum sativum TaxID=3888 RepID=A0A9D4W339_PEA|nr:hypothetical protein KIW84_061672 [Pisum sativum]